MLSTSSSNASASYERPASFAISFACAMTRSSSVRTRSTSVLASAGRPASPGFKPKKSVALSGIAAGTTALCTVGRSGNDLNYRGYDILEIAEHAEFEEIAYLLVHGRLPNGAELANYKAKLKQLRGLPASVRSVLEHIPAGAHPMDVMRTGCSAMGTALPEKDDHNLPGARDIADRLMASFGSVLGLSPAACSKSRIAPSVLGP